MHKLLPFIIHTRARTHARTPSSFYDLTSVLYIKKNREKISESKHAFYIFILILAIGKFLTCTILFKFLTTCSFLLKKALNLNLNDKLS